MPVSWMPTLELLGLLVPFQVFPSLLTQSPSALLNTFYFMPTASTAYLRPLHLAQHLYLTAKYILLCFLSASHLLSSFSLLLLQTIDQVFQMLSRLLLCWPNTKLLHLLFWVEFLQCNHCFNSPHLLSEHFLISMFGTYA